MIAVDRAESMLIAFLAKCSRNHLPIIMTNLDRAALAHDEECAASWETV